MEYRALGKTGLKVSLISLGTMTWGEQNTEAEAHAQMDVALDRGVNFWDTAELYAVPPKQETYGKTEEMIGTWFAKTGKRDDVILATKISGPGRPWIGCGFRKFNRQHITEALEGSLKRLQTDHVDLYQLHWPERLANNFGYLGYGHVGYPGLRNDCSPMQTNPDADDDWTAFEDTLEVLQDFIQQGKIRHIGLSNETAWGTMEYIRIARQKGLPEVVSIQNPYSLLNRSYEVGLSEVSLREGCGLLAYSPLAFGLLTGKYRHGQTPKGRISLYPVMSRYNNANAREAVEAYACIADDFGVSLTHLSLAFINQQPFVTSNIIGATTLDQLHENIDSATITLPAECFEAIERVHAQYTYPCP